MSEPLVAGVVLAAGRALRFGGDRPKQLLEIGGEPLVRRVVRTALRSRLWEVVVVIGHRGSAVREALADLAVRRVENPDFRDGQSTSVKTGLASLSPGIAAAMFLPADQPLLSPATIDRLIAAWEETAAPIVAPVHEGRRGAPVLFDRSLFCELEALRGDTGGRAVMPNHAGEIVTIEVDDPRELADVDTAEDLRRLTEMSCTTGHPPKLEPEDYYFDSRGLMVFTREFHLKRGTCCESGCRHCPWGFSG